MFFSKSSPSFPYLTLFLTGLLGMLLLNFFYLQQYFADGWPAGWDASGHFTISQLYYDSHWPNLDGKLESFFEGFYFPRFYPPIFYMLLGFLYWLFPSVERVLLFKLLVVGTVVVLPSMLAVFARSIGLRLVLCYVALSLSIIFLSTGEDVSQYMMGLMGALEVGLCTQAFAAIIFLILLMLYLNEFNKVLRCFLLVIFSGLFFLSNFHVTLAGSVILLVYTGIIIHRDKSINYVNIIALIIGFLLASPWYWNVLIHRSDTPSVPGYDLPVTASVIGYLLMAILALLAGLVFEKKVHSKLSVFCVASLISTPFLIASITPLSLAIAWQPHRMWALINLFLPLYLVHAYSVIKTYAADKEPWLDTRVFLAAFMGLITLLYSYMPIENESGKLLKGETESIAKLNSFIQANPTSGYSIISFSSNFHGMVSSVDIALSHYIALSGTKAIWATFRESSFNSIFATTLRNLISSRNESYGIPTSIDAHEYEKIPMHKRLRSLSRWGVDRILFRSKNQKDFPHLKKLTEIEYQDAYFTIARLKAEPVLSFNAEQAIFLLGEPIVLSKQRFDFATLAERLVVSFEKGPPILLFRSCEEINNRVGDGQWKIACTAMQSCCHKLISTYKDLQDQSLYNNINVNVENSSALTWDTLVAAPWRKATLIK